MLKNPNRKNGKVHLNRLFDSEKDTVALGYAVEERFITVTNQWMEPPPRGKGEPLVPPQALDRDMILWRQMRIRHKQLDFRNTEDELRATKRIALWTLQVNALLVNQPVKTVEWKD